MGQIFWAAKLKHSASAVARGTSVDMWNAPWIPWTKRSDFRAALNPLIQVDSIAECELSLVPIDS